jgi:hypothetical protein
LSSDEDGIPPCSSGQTTVAEENVSITSRLKQNVIFNIGRIEQQRKAGKTKRIKKTKRKKGGDNTKHP